MSIILHPYGLFVFALFYNIFLRGGIIFCDSWNPLESIAGMLISDPLTDQPESQLDQGIINYPQPLLSISDILLSHPSSDSSCDSITLTTRPHALMGLPPLPLSEPVLADNSSSSHKSSMGLDSLSESDEDAYRTIVGNPRCGLINTFEMSVRSHEFLYSMYGGFPIEEPVHEPVHSLTFEPPLESTLSPLQSSFNNFATLVVNKNPTIDDMRTYINYIRDTMPEELWSKTETDLSKDGTDITNLINGLDDIIVLPKKDNLIELIYYKTTISVYNVLQVTNNLNEDAILYDLFEHALIRYADHYFSSPNKP